MPVPPPPDTVPPALTLTLFGPLRVLVQGQPLARLRSRRAVWLLALLALRDNRPVEREWLAGTLWPESEQSQAFNNLRVVLSELRKAFGSEGARFTSPDRHTLLLDLAGASVDVRAFDAAILNGKPSALAEAVRLYQGPLLEGCLEEWVFQERVSREQDCLRALQTLADAALAAGDYGTAADYFQRSVGLDPWSDAVRRGWMEALAKGGDTNAALQVYRDFLALLRSDPKAVPDEQTSLLYQQLRAGARQKAAPPAPIVQEAETAVVEGYLPHPLTDLVGRREECREIAVRLRRSRLVTLTGPGGIGKTRLALAVASESVEEYADGVWLIALEALIDGRMVIAQIASVLGVREEAGRPFLESLTAALRQKRLLLLLDNCEHLLEASAEAAAYLLKECPRLRILATSREGLGITGEAAWTVPPLALPPPGSLLPGGVGVQRQIDCESVQLFVERAQAAQKNFLLTPKNAPAVAQVCAQLEGIPLAIELVAARVKATTVEQIAARLGYELDLLAGGNRAAQPRQQTLQATLDWSYALLNAPEQALLRRFAVFAGGASLEGTEAVCAGGEIEAWRILHLLTSLVEKSLVLFEEGDGEGSGRYRLLEMVRQYAHVRLLATREAEQVRACHWNWCLTFTEEVAPEKNRSHQAQVLQRMDAEQDNLRAALAWSAAQAQEAEAELRLCGVWGLYWNTRGHYSRGRQYLRRALERADPNAVTPVRAKALSVEGSLASSQGDYPAAQALFEESLRLRRQLGDRAGVAELLGHLSGLDYLQSRYAEARERLEESLRLCRELDERSRVAWHLNMIGVVAHAQGDYAAAQAVLEEGLTLYQKLGARMGIAKSLGDLGNVAYARGRYAEAQRLLEASLVIRRETGNRKGTAWLLHILGTIAQEQGDDAAAQERYEESLSIRRETGDRRGIAASLNHLGGVAINQKEYALARTLLAERLILFRELGEKRGLEDTLRVMAVVLLEQEEAYSAALLLGVTDRLRREIGMGLPAQDQDRLDRQTEQTRSRLGESAFTAAWEEGCALGEAKAIELALTCGGN